MTIGGGTDRRSPRTPRWASWVVLGAMLWLCLVLPVLACAVGWMAV